MPSFPQAEQLLLVMMHEFHDLALHETQTLYSQHFHERYCISYSHLLHSSSVPASPALACPFSVVPLVLWQLGASMFLFCSFLPIMPSALTRACRWVLVHLLRNRTPTCRALVNVRTLALTNPGPPSSHAANPNINRSATAALVTGMAMISATDFILQLASDVGSCTKYRPCAACASYSSHRNSMWSLSFFLRPPFRSLSDQMMTPSSLLPMMCLISSRAGLSLKSQFVMSSAAADEIDTQFNELFSMFATLMAFSRDPSNASSVVTATA